MYGWDGRTLIRWIPVFERGVALFPGTFSLLEWWQRLFSQVDTLELHGMAAMVPAMRCLRELRFGLEVYYW